MASRSLTVLGWPAQFVYIVCFLKLLIKFEFLQQDCSEFPLNTRVGQIENNCGVCFLVMQKVAFFWHRIEPKKTKQKI